MSVSSKVKAVLNIKGKDHKQLADFLKISSQALSNKIQNQSVELRMGRLKIY